MSNKGRVDDGQVSNMTGIDKNLLFMHIVIKLGRSLFYVVTTLDL